MNFSKTRFTPGQPIGLHKSQFTPELQEEIIRRHFDPSSPGGYGTLASNIQNYEAHQAMQEQMTEQPQPQQNIQQAPQLSQEQIQRQLDQYLGAMPTPRTNEQNLGTQNEPQPQAPTQAPTPQNESTDIMERLFGINSQTPKQEQTPNVNTEQRMTQPQESPEDIRVAQTVRSTIARVCSERNIEPKEFLEYAYSLSMDDVADLYVAFKGYMQQQEGARQAQMGQQQQQPAMQAPIQQQQPVPNPINLAEVQPNPDTYNQQINNLPRSVKDFWR